MPKKLSEKDRDVHTQHCCVIHGCKYGEDDFYCTVSTHKKRQSFPCEACYEMGITTVEMIYEILSKGCKVKRCPHCNHVLQDETQ